MQTAEKDGPVFALIIHDASDQFFLATLTNQKGFTKSLENGLLWVVDGNTGRLLPLTELNADFSQLLIDGGRSDKARYLAHLEKHAGYATATLDFIIPAKTAQNGEKTSGAKPKVDEVAAFTANQSVYSKEDQAELAGFLFTLQDLIRKRKQEMPEGSYTTHLFKSGPAKIRKKTGEEAVELILAQDQPEIASEASDLLYHMLVLLVDSQVSLEMVLQELRKR